MRSSSSALGASAAVLSSSASESKTERRTPAAAAKRRWEGCLHGLAYTMRSGDTPAWEGERWARSHLETRLGCVSAASRLRLGCISRLEDEAHLPISPHISPYLTPRG